MLQHMRGPLHSCQINLPFAANWDKMNLSAALQRRAVSVY